MTHEEEVAATSSPVSSWADRLRQSVAPRPHSSSAGSITISRSSTGTVLKVQHASAPAPGVVDAAPPPVAAAREENEKIRTAPPAPSEGPQRDDSSPPPSPSPTPTNRATASATGTTTSDASANPAKPRTSSGPGGELAELRIPSPVEAAPAASSSWGASRSPLVAAAGSSEANKDGEKEAPPTAASIDATAAGAAAAAHGPKEATEVEGSPSPAEPARDFVEPANSGVTVVESGSAKKKKSKNNKHKKKAAATPGLVSADGEGSPPVSSASKESSTEKKAPDDSTRLFDGEGDAPETSSTPAAASREDTKESCEQPQRSQWPATTASNAGALQKLSGGQQSVMVIPTPPAAKHQDHWWGSKGAPTGATSSSSSSSANQIWWSSEATPSFPSKGPYQSKNKDKQHNQNWSHGNSDYQGFYNTNTWNSCGKAEGSDAAASGQYYSGVTGGVGGQQYYQQSGPYPSKTGNNGTTKGAQGSSSSSTSAQHGSTTTAAAPGKGINAFKDPRGYKHQAYTQVKKIGENQDGATVTKVSCSKVCEQLDDAIRKALHAVDCRSFLLRIERNILIALNSDRHERIVLTTAFTAYKRLLCHRLADYYGFEREITALAEAEQTAPSELEDPLNANKAKLTLLKTAHSRIAKPSILEICQQRGYPLPEKFANGYRLTGPMRTLQLPKSRTAVGTSSSSSGGSSKAGGGRGGLSGSGGAPFSKECPGPGLTSILEEGNESDEEELLLSEQQNNQEATGEGDVDVNTEDHMISVNAQKDEVESDGGISRIPPTINALGNLSGTGGAAAGGAASRLEGTEDMTDVNNWGRSMQKSSNRSGITDSPSESLHRKRSISAENGTGTESSITRSGSSGSAKAAGATTKRPIVVRRRTDDFAGPGGEKADKEKKKKEDEGPLTYEDRQARYAREREAVLGADFKADITPSGPPGPSGCSTTGDSFGMLGVTVGLEGGASAPAAVPGGVRTGEQMANHRHFAPSMRGGGGGGGGNVSPRGPKGKAGKQGNGGKGLQQQQQQFYKGQHNSGNNLWEHIQDPEFSTERDSRYGSTPTKGGMKHQSGKSSKNGTHSHHLQQNPSPYVNQTPQFFPQQQPQHYGSGPSSASMNQQQAAQLGGGGVNLGNPAHLSDASSRMLGATPPLYAQQQLAPSAYNNGGATYRRAGGSFNVTPTNDASRHVSRIDGSTEMMQHTPPIHLSGTPGAVQHVPGSSGGAAVHLAISPAIGAHGPALVGVPPSFGPATPGHSPALAAAMTHHQQMEALVMATQHQQSAGAQRWGQPGQPPVDQAQAIKAQVEQAQQLMQLKQIEQHLQSRGIAGTTSFAAGGGATTTQQRGGPLSTQQPGHQGGVQQYQYNYPQQGVVAQQQQQTAYGAPPQPFVPGVQSQASWQHNGRAGTGAW